MEKQQTKEKIPARTAPMTEDLTKIINDFSNCWHLDKSSGCWVWSASGEYGSYGYFSYLGETRAHRVSYILYIGPIPNDLLVLHKCDRRSCVNPDHLFVGTQKDNVRDMVDKGRHGKSTFDPDRICCRHGCDALALPFKTRCETHQEEHRKHNRKWRQNVTRKKRNKIWERVWKQKRS